MQSTAFRRAAVGKWVPGKASLIHVAATRTHADVSMLSQPRRESVAGNIPLAAVKVASRHLGGHSTSRTVKLELRCFVISGSNWRALRGLCLTHRVVPNEHSIVAPGPQGAQVAGWFLAVRTRTRWPGQPDSPHMTGGHGCLSTRPLPEHAPRKLGLPAVSMWPNLYRESGRVNRRGCGAGVTDAQ